MQFKRLISIIILLCLCINVYAAELKASLQDNNVTFGTTFVLKLILQDAKAIQSVDLSGLAKDFMVHGQQQFSSYNNVNGRITAEEGWYISLLPRRDGKMTIPAIEVVTNKGNLQTAPIEIVVHKHTAGKQGNDSVLGISLVAAVSKNKVYVNEPVIYTLKIVSYRPLGQISFDEIRSENAIIEKMSEPKQYDQVIDGVVAQVIELKYAVTPLVEGKIKIKPATVYGEMHVPSSSTTQQRMKFGLFNNMFSNTMFELQPFSVRGEDIVLTAMPPVSANNNWLPLYNLNISEQWDGLSDTKVGSTITRRIRMIADGTFGQQLPDLEKMQAVDGLKLYANKPVIINDVSKDGAFVVGSKETEFSLVPSKPGVIQMPEVKITWWNMRTKQWSMSVLPAKTINVADVAGGGSDYTVVDYTQQDDGIALSEQKPKQGASYFEANKWVFAIIVGLLLIIAGLVAVVVWLILRAKAVRSGVKPAKVRPSKGSVDVVINDYNSLKEHIINYAIMEWGAPQNIIFGRLGEDLLSRGYSFDAERYEKLKALLHQAWYTQRGMDFTQLLELWAEFKETVHKVKAVRQEVMHKEYSDLNPT